MRVLRGATAIGALALLARTAPPAAADDCFDAFGPPCPGAITTTTATALYQTVATTTSRAQLSAALV
ncbi:MAG: hypothetical protein M3680_36245, partial [Myxococcota bacterium]|nr:hypothetical protein [Myxococcota bacterium]